MKVLFFGATADSAGSRQVEIPVNQHETVEQFTARLTVAYPRLRNHKLLISVNEEYVDAQVILAEGDQVAVFTPVSGG